MAYTDIDKPTDYFETVTYTGNGTGQDITTLDFQPDWLWIKRRDSAGSHRIQNSITGTTNYLQSNKENAEQSGGAVDAFLSNGFSLNTSDAAYNGSGATYVGWSWLAGGTASSNTDGSITSNVSANTTSGFSIVSYTGTGANATVGHGLGVAPKMIITKSRGTTNNWGTYHHSLGNTDAVFLNLTNATDTSSGYWNNTSPTSSVFSVGSAAGTNPSATMIAYCFAEKKGFSKFGSYTGNGSTDGTFVYTGFKPAWFMTKRTDIANGWVMFDNKRSSSGGFNEIDYNVIANTNEAEETSNTVNDVDFCSNGIKITEDNNGLNASGGSYIYMCFAESPFTTSTGIPTTAR